MLAVRRARTLITVLAAAAVLSISLSACTPGLNDVYVLPSPPNLTNNMFVTPSPAPNPPGWVASGPPIIVTPDPSIQMSVDVPVTLFTNANPDGVIPGVTMPSTFTVGSEPVHITAVVTYHYVMPSGVQATGQISLHGPDNTVYGPWATIGSEGQGGIANASWQADVNLVLPSGTYTIIDSDPATWSANEGTSGSGMFWVNGTATTP